MQQQTQHRKAETKENLLAESVTLEACWRRSRRGNAYLVGNFSRDIEKRLRMHC